MAQKRPRKPKLTPTGAKLVPPIEGAELVVLRPEQMSPRDIHLTLSDGSRVTLPISQLDPDTVIDILRQFWAHAQDFGGVLTTDLLMEMMKVRRTDDALREGQLMHTYAARQAVRELARRGVEARAIMQMLGVSSPAFYNRFGDCYRQGKEQADPK